MVDKMNECPPFDNFFRPLLVLASQNEVSVRESAEKIADQFNLTTDAKLETTKSGNVKRYIDRTHWSATYLRQAGLVIASRRGYIKATNNGLKFLKKYPNKISVSDLKQIPSFVNFVTGKSAKKITNKNSKPYSSSKTPEDRISEAIEEIENDIATQILDRLINSPPEFFEKVVLQVLISMGYGGTQENAGKHVGKSGDNGIDGVIDQDPLGLDRVYIQAKRYDLQNKVSNREIRDFSGSLDVHQATKGLFVTTSSFTESAYQTAEKIGKRIVLLDGEKLARIMIATKVGCSLKAAFSIVKIDEDYFSF